MKTEDATGRRWQLVAGHRERVLSLVLSRLDGTADAEDCVQEALIRAATFENLDESRVGAFLTATVLRLCVDHQRRVDRQRRLALKLVVTDGDSAEDHVCEEAAGRWLMGKTTFLGERERQVMLARAAGMSTLEAAQALHISRKSAESAFTRARGHLKSMYYEEMSR